jgi:hypothetical protein
MQFVQSNQKHHRRLRWQWFWPRSWLTFIMIIQMLMADAVIGLEIWSMILNIRYSFFFIGFIASFFFTLTWISTFNVGEYSRGLFEHERLFFLNSLLLSKITGMCNICIDLPYYIDRRSECSDIL